MQALTVSVAPSSCSAASLLSWFVFSSLGLSCKMCFPRPLLWLQVLETCVKNCGYRFHILVTTRDFVEGVLVRSIIPRNNPPLVLHDRVLSIIQVRCCPVLSLGVVMLLCSLAVICGFLLSRRGLMHSVARPTWRAWCRCTKTCEGKDLSSPWQSWMVTRPSKLHKRYKRGRCSHAADTDTWVLPFIFAHFSFGSFLCLCLPDFAWERARCHHLARCAPLFQTSAHPTPDFWAKTGPGGNQCLHSQPGDGRDFSTLAKLLSLRLSVHFGLQSSWNQ